jgi:hypothetical protein
VGDNVGDGLTLGQARRPAESVTKPMSDRAFIAMFLKKNG